MRNSVLYVVLLLSGVFSFLNSTAQQLSKLYEKGIAQGEVKNPQLSEISGIAPAYTDRLFWVHNDSGDSAKIYLIDRSCQLQKSFVLEGIDAIDMEDMGKFSVEGQNYLVLADIGDNLAQRKHVFLYIFPEPSISDHRLIPRHSIRKIELNYPDKPKDAEAILLDPLKSRLYLISKREFQSTLYETDIFSDTTQNSYTLSKSVSLPFTFTTSAAISSDGTQIVIKNLLNIYYWARNPLKSIPETLKQIPLKLDYQPEPQGEAITFASDRSGFYTISERPFGLASYLNFYKKL